MKQRTNQFYQRLPKELKTHILKNLMLSDLDKKILCSLMEHDAETAFHCQNVGITEKKLNRHLLDIHDNVLREIIRLSVIQINTEKQQK